MGATPHVTDFGAANSIHFTEDASELGRQLKSAAPVRYIELNSARFDSWRTCWRSLGEALGFPDDQYRYAANPNAFLDWLTDFSWSPPFTGLIVVLQDCRHLWVQSPLEMGVLIEVWLHAADYWASQGAPCHLIFECRNP